MVRIVMKTIWESSDKVSLLTKNCWKEGLQPSSLSYSWYALGRAGSHAMQPNGQPPTTHWPARSQTSLEIPRLEGNPLNGTSRRSWGLVVWSKHSWEQTNWCSFWRGRGGYYAADVLWLSDSRRGRLPASGRGAKFSWACTKSDKTQNVHKKYAVYLGSIRNTWFKHIQICCIIYWNAWLGWE